jgi:DNA-binding NarL/FixJ family response regulator
MHILIADDHPLFHNGMRTLLSSVADMEVVGVATNGDETVTMASELQLHVILMDLQMPGISGIEATRRIVKTNPNIRILVVTMFEDDHSVFTALRAGARGYVLKDADEEEILRAIRAVASGEAIFSATIAQRLIDFFATPQSAVLPQIFPELTEREREILDLIAQGHNNNDIAHRLVLSQRTVANHVSNIFSKLQVWIGHRPLLRRGKWGWGRNDPSSPISLTEVLTNTQQFDTLPLLHLAGGILPLCLMVGDTPRRPRLLAKCLLHIGLPLTLR